MTCKHKLFITLFVLYTGVVLAQTKTFKEAEDIFNNYAYMDAIVSYEELLANGYSEEKSLKHLGDANYFNAKYKKAAEWYNKLLSLTNNQQDPEYIYRYAQCLKSDGRYVESDTWMEKLSTLKGSDQRVLNFLSNTDYLAKIEEVPNRTTIKKLNINSTASDFAPTMHQNDLYFSTAVDTGLTSNNIHGWNKQPFLDILRAKLGDNGAFMEPQKLPKAINKKTHESSTAFTNDGAVMYFTRNNSDNGRFKRDKERVSRLKLYKATKRNKKWKKIKELPLNNDNYSIAHPTLSSDEKWLYFASDMPGTMGASDIFVAEILEDGGYGEPKNLGNTINTEARETFPFIVGDVLYFASDGHPGLGGLDLFAVDLSQGNSAKVINLGKPINSTNDDFSITYDPTTKKGYFASNREGGMGSDDIYVFEENEPLNLDCTKTITGIVVDALTQEVIKNTTVIGKQENDSLVFMQTTNDEGVFTNEIPCDLAEIVFEVDQLGYEKLTKSVLISEAITKATLSLNQIEKVVSIGEDLAVSLGLELIYFDYGKWNIRPDAAQKLLVIVDYLNAQKSVKIEIDSHTDSRASRSFNMRLSNKRAEETREFIVKQGISPIRVTAKGLGESKLANHCKDHVDCSEAEHRENRRSEFIVIEN